MNAAAEPRAAEFENLKPEGGPQTNRDVNMDVILDVPVTLSMEVGRTRIPIRNPRRLFPAHTLRKRISVRPKQHLLRKRLQPLP